MDAKEFGDMMGKRGLTSVLSIDHLLKPPIPFWRGQTLNKTENRGKVTESER